MKSSFLYRKENMDDIRIAYQNKDITSKVLAENFKGKTFSVYGLNLPDIVRVLPTNIPVILANELRLDNLFELADGTVAIVDYESEYRKKDKIKYLNYITGTANRYLKEQQDCPLLRMIVIYTGDIKRHQVKEEYNIGAIKLKIEAAFLSELNDQEIFIRLTEKVKRKEQLTDEELMEFIILPLSYHKIEEKIKETVELATQIADRQQQMFALVGIAVFTDKIIDKETANKIRGMIKMTQIAQLFEEEKQQEIQQALQQALQQAAEDYRAEKQQMILKMLKKDYSIEEIMSLVKGYSKKEIEILKESLTKEEISQ